MVAVSGASSGGVTGTPGKTPSGTPRKRWFVNSSWRWAEVTGVQGEDGVLSGSRGDG